MAYRIVELVLLVWCIVGIIWIQAMKRKYRENGGAYRAEVIAYFKSRNAVNYATGIDNRDIPQEMRKNKFFNFLVQDKTLILERGRFYLNNLD